MLIASSIALIRRYARYRSELACISRLDERTLRDIGLSRGELTTAAWRNTAPRQALISVRSSANQKGPRLRGPFGFRETIRYHLMSAGSLPPFAASFTITCLCSHMFMAAESLVSPL